MNIRERFEAEEHEILSKNAAFADSTKGRMYPEEESPMRTAFQRDRDRIIHSKSFRRLKHKTQVFLAPYGDHYRTRLTHTLEVSQIARSIAKAIRANEDLTEAIALGHDLGHTPFGHAGERALTKVSNRPFNHNEQSVRVVEKLENSGKGLNLTWEVRNGILCHKTSLVPATLEGDIVRMSDKIAYINHDIDDGIRAGILTEDDLPHELTDILGHSTRDRLNNVIINIVENSQDTARVTMTKELSDSLFKLRKYMFDELYTNPKAKGEEGKACNIIEMLYSHYYEHPEDMTHEYVQMLSEGESKETVVCDYISGMTDNYAVMKYSEYFIPKGWGMF